MFARKTLIQDERAQSSARRFTPFRKKLIEESRGRSVVRVVFLGEAGQGVSLLVLREATRPRAERNNTQQRGVMVRRQEGHHSFMSSDVPLLFLDCRMSQL